ncbi:hypothetical protein LCGC14_3047060 [marine sediment metagenome]|uniref:Uncharacterized protein n=1 Tax=marine sediment metagenome TaxID=412755 RepID=A0A0F8ZDQ7_9ZZZZ
MADLTPIPLSAAVNHGEQYLNMTFSNVGNQGVLVPPDPTIITIGRIETSLGGLAIAPGSDIDRCRVSYTVPSLGAEEGGLLTQDTVLSVDRPLLRSLRAPIVLSADITTFYDDLLLPEGAATGGEVPYGTALPVFVAPILILNLGLDFRGLGIINAKRHPDHFSILIGAADADTEVLAAVHPCLGRKKITLNMRASGPGLGIMDVRVAVVRGVAGAAIPALIEKQLSPVAFPTTVTLNPAVGNVDRSQFDLDESDNFLNFYVTRTGGGAADNALIQVDLTD